MALSFKCQFCGNDIVVRYLGIGEEAVCRYCDKHVTVPPGATEIELSPDERPPVITVGKSAPPKEVESVTITNPWTGMWFYPRESVRLAIDSNRRIAAYIFAAIYGMVHNLHLVWRHGVSAETGIPLWGIIVINMMFGASIGYVMLTLYSWIISWISRLLGGLRSAKNARIALGWSCLPYVVLLVIVPLMFVEPETFVFHPRGEVVVSELSRIYFALRGIMTIWFLVIIVIASSEALELSLARAFVVLLTLGVLLVLSTFLLVLLLAALL
jgi:hypothetical protein